MAATDAAGAILCGVSASLDADDGDTMAGSGNMPGNSVLIKAAVVSIVPEKHEQ